MGLSRFAGHFVLIWMKQRLIWFNLQRDGTRNGLSNIKEAFIENLQLKMSPHKKISEILPLHSGIIVVLSNK